MADSLAESKNKDSLQRDIEPDILAHEFSERLGIESPTFKRYCGTQVGEQAKYVQIRFTDKQVKDWGNLEVIHLTDVQFGHVCCKVERVKEFIDWILKVPNRFLVFGGDMVDAAHVSSPGGPYENLFKPQKQIHRFCELIAPVAHRVLGSVGGNHEARAMLHFGDLGILLATILRIPYSSGQQYVDIHWGKHSPFRIELWHGRGAARTKGAKINMVNEHMLQNPDANLILVGHLHEPIVTFNWVKKPDAANMKVGLVKQGGAMSSSFLEFWGNYGEIKGLSATDALMARAILEPNGKWELTLR